MPWRIQAGNATLVDQVGKSHRLCTTTAETRQVQRNLGIGIGGEEGGDTLIESKISSLNDFIPALTSLPRSGFPVAGAAARGRVAERINGIRWLGLGADAGEVKAIRIGAFAGQSREVRNVGLKLSLGHILTVVLRAVKI